MDINFSFLSGGERFMMKSVPKDFKFDTQVSFILNGFNHREFVFLDPIHKLPWATFFICDFVYLFIEEETLCFLDCTFEVFPIF